MREVGGLEPNYPKSSAALILQLGQIIDQLEMQADDLDSLKSWSKDFGGHLEDEGERLSDLSARIANAHRIAVPLISRAITRMPQSA